MYVRFMVMVYVCLMPAIGVAQVQQMEGHDMSHGDQEIPATRDGSGTSWLPDETPMYAVHRQSRGWMLMGHGNLFLQYLRETGDRGNRQAGSINWVMGMAERPAAGGRVTLRSMISAEPWTIAGCGYPTLLATGESCGGGTIHDRQHPHDLFMELAAKYERPLAGGVRLEIYGGPVGEPALGPVAFGHRVSAASNPIAPIAHHWLDSTHITYGVVTGGLFGPRWKIEASLFNGREPDENRKNIDLAAFDSWSARVAVMPTSHWALQASAGLLKEAEPGLGGAAGTNVGRMTASATYHRATLENTTWASTIGWGRNAEHHGDATNALLAETSVTMHERDTWYGRFEWANKSEHDLDVPTTGVFTIAKVQGGYTRYFAARKHLTSGLGAFFSIGVVPDRLEGFYGRRVNPGMGVYLTLRPALLGT